MLNAGRLMRYWERGKRYHVLLGLMVSAGCGALIAVGAHPAPQAPVESGQVLAGIVVYPPDNPFYLYHVKLWTLLNQLAAFLLQAGMSEISTSFFFEALTAGLSFASLFMITFSLSGRIVVSVFTPLFMYYFNFVGIDIAYPIRLLGTTHTYGIFGLSWMLFVIGCFGVGWRRMGAFLAGMAIAVHLSLGAFCVAVTALTVSLNWRETKQHLRGMAWSFAAGVGVTMISFGWQWHLFSSLPAGDPALKQRYLEAFIRNLDFHRAISGWGHSGFLLALLVSGIAIAALYRRRYKSDGAMFVLTALASSVAVALLFVSLIEFVPTLSYLQVLMPWRFLGFANLCTMPLVFGILTSDNPDVHRLRAVLFMVVIVLCALWTLPLFPEVKYLYLAIAVLVLFLITIPLPDVPDSPFRPFARWQTGAVATFIAILGAITVLPSATSLATRSDITSAGIFRLASGRPGMLLTAGDMHLMQLLTRRPVLMDGGALDIFTIVPEAGPSFNAILKEVYGIDLFETQVEGERNKAVISYAHQQLWESRTEKEWRRIRLKYGVTDIFAPSGWFLRLPVVADDGELTLYTIP